MNGQPTVPARTDARVHDLLDEATADRPGAWAVTDGTGRWTYRELTAHSHAVDAWLRAKGVGHGDRVLVQLPSTRELVALLYGTARRGAVLVPVNTGMKDYHLRAVVENAEPALIVVADPAVDRIGALAGEVPVLGLGPAWAEITELREREVRPAEVPVGADDIAVLVYTSGSTAAPKAVICPHGRMVFATEAIGLELGYRPDDVVFCRFPISWDYGLYKVLLTAAGRSELVLADGESDLVLLRRIRETGATIVPIVPSLATMICALAAREPAREPRVRLFTNTGAALPKSTADALRTAFPGAEVVVQFGQTECKRVSVLPPAFQDAKPHSVGRPLPGTRAFAVDDEGRPLPPWQTGEIVVEGPHVMPGYWRAPEQTARAFRPAPGGGLRLHTGDFGHVDEDGFLYYEGRRDDMFKHKGVRMSTTEIEAAATDVPGVRAAAVLPPAEDSPLAVFAEGDIDPHTLLKELSLRLEPAKVPTVARVVAELPLTPHGKHDRKALARLLEGATA
ncbi:class I adenylate-forming enzyme family protein [Streptomyces rubradiris]|uniref:AMP-dependent ligase n=1 Tax=Streptomyces rubradiris TaxID=285531 RepID=A0ABQ3R2U2_STRRR|nr:AMP-binding protein [Streptomyces rubradiris]GHH00718.1 AMP-dependent ligase [Streptomyces rubradiris]GHI50158.1 AMP-dependent ligase [Streptomyces rubradiris]